MRAEVEPCDMLEVPDAPWLRCAVPVVPCEPWFTAGEPVDGCVAAGLEPLFIGVVGDGDV
jgi:hypothetical protein